jgi:hypothetical protein
MVLSVMRVMASWLTASYTSPTMRRRAADLYRRAEARYTARTPNDSGQEMRLWHELVAARREFILASAFREQAEAAVCVVKP